MSDEVEPEKDFRYYADAAEAWLEEAERWTSQSYNQRRFEHALKSADVYARLAEAASRIIELNERTPTTR